MYLKFIGLFRWYTVSSWSHESTFCNNSCTYSVVYCIYCQRFIILRNFIYNLFINLDIRFWSLCTKAQICKQTLPYSRLCSQNHHPKISFLRKWYILRYDFVLFLKQDFWIVICCYMTMSSMKFLCFVPYKFRVLSIAMYKNKTN